MNMLSLVENPEKSEFYPTPASLAEMMLKDENLLNYKYILEPSAGKGDLLAKLAMKASHTYNNEMSVDCIEKDAQLREVLKYNFSHSRERSLSDRYYELYKKRANLTNAENEEYKRINDERTAFFAKGINIVHDDFLSFNSYKKYDLILMNPPFSEGDKHLLKALDIQKNGGRIICLLNAETIRNPYTSTRKALITELNKYEHTISFIENAFANAERKANVDVAIVKVTIPTKEIDSSFFNRMKAAEKVEELDRENNELELTDFIKATISMYNVEVRAGLELIKEYKAFIPYMRKSFEKDDDPILQLSFYGTSSYGIISENEYLEKVRYKYWKGLLGNKKFIGKLTSRLQTEYQERLSELKKYDFTEYNISVLASEMSAKIREGIEEEIVAMFDRMTYEHTYNPEFTQNRHYFDGWKTNKAYKIEKKVILPCYGVFDRWDGKPRVYDAHSTLCDIERIFNFLDGNMTREVNAYHELEQNFMNGNTKNIELKYFKATFYKKGTVHLVFTNPKLVERFNIYVTKYKKWLPPSFGEKLYKDMDREERAATNSFCGCEKGYNEILANSAYYLAPVTSNVQLALETAEAC